MYYIAQIISAVHAFKKDVFKALRKEAERIILCCFLFIVYLQ